MDAFFVPPESTDSDAPESTGSDATEHSSEHAPEEAVAPEPPTKKQRTERTDVSEEQPGHATGDAEYSEDDCDEILPPVITSLDAATTVADATGKKQMFTTSLAHRDDWLHRGIMLHDMEQALRLTPNGMDWPEKDFPTPFVAN